MRGISPLYRPQTLTTCVSIQTAPHCAGAPFQNASFGTAFIILQQNARFVKTLSSFFRHLYGNFIRNREPEFSFPYFSPAERRQIAAYTIASTSRAREKKASPPPT